MELNTIFVGNSIKPLSTYFSMKSLFMESINLKSKFSVINGLDKTWFNSVVKVHLQ